MEGVPSKQVERRKDKELIRSDFWFNDGNVVIIAESAAFKVHRGQLERHSEVFHGLFEIPQPDDQEFIDGCIWVELYDSPSDIFYFLSALYDGLYFNKPGAGDFPAVSAVLRLSTKYLVDYLRQRCLARLHKEWPSTLSGWDKREQKATDESGRYAPREHITHPILAIKLAVQMNIASILPAALYDLSRYGPSRIITGTQLPPLACNASGCRTTEQKVQEKCSVLPRDWILMTLRGRERGQHFIADFISRELQCRKPSASCFHKNSPDKPSKPCLESFYFIKLNILRSVGGIAFGRDADPLFTLVQATEMLTRTDFSDGQRQCGGLRICDPCKSEFAACTAKARTEAWELIPQWFGLIEEQEHGSGTTCNTL